MAQLEKFKAIVLKKTKLSENDLIITFLLEDGSQLRAVAKGARKPTSIFSARLDLFNIVDIYSVRGKSLYILRDVKLITWHSTIKKNMDKFLCSSVVSELLYKSTHYKLICNNLFDITKKFLYTLDNVENKHYYNPLCFAALWKICFYLGVGPIVDRCIYCEKSINIINFADSIHLSFNILDGGLICRSCSKNHEAININSGTIKLIYMLLYTKFDRITLLKINDEYIKDMLKLARQWINCHLGCHIKSLNFI